MLNIGIKHGFLCINIRQVRWQVLKTEAEGRGFQHLPRHLANVNALKNHVWSLLLHKSENICYISRYFLHYFVSPFHRCRANAISTDYARSGAGQYTSRDGSNSVSLIRMGKGRCGRIGLGLELGFRIRRLYNVASVSMQIHDICSKCLYFDIRCMFIRA